MIALLNKKFEGLIRLTNYEDIKKDIMEIYFAEFSKEEMCNVQLLIRYSDNMMYKYIGFSKKIYRTYFLQLKISEVKKSKKLIELEEKDLLKPLINRIFKLEKANDTKLEKNVGLG